MPLVAKHRFTTKDFYRMAETGLLKPDARVELLDGQLIDMSPIGPVHAGLVNGLTRLFSKSSKDRYIVAVQNPVHLDDHS